MSNHAIGRGINIILKKIFQRFDEGKINRETTIDLIHDCISALYYDDGNADEALNGINTCRCGMCLKKSDKIINPYELMEWNYQEIDKLDDAVEENTAYLAFCEECWKKVLKMKAEKYPEKRKLEKPKNRTNKNEETKMLKKGHNKCTQK